MAEDRGLGEASTRIDAQPRRVDLYLVMTMTAKSWITSSSRMSRAVVLQRKNKRKEALWEAKVKQPAAVESWSPLVVAGAARGSPDSVFHFYIRLTGGGG